MESRPARQSASRHNMPARLTSFVGRERELAGVARLLKSHRLVTLTGAGGCGKTRLATEAASREVAAFPDGVFFVSLAALADTSLVVSAIGEVLAIRGTVDQPLVESVKQALREQRLLLVVDNFEHLLPASPLLSELLAACPALQILVTSREALRLDGERVYPIPPLTLPGDGRLKLVADDPPETGAESEAIRLFAARAASVQPHFRLDSVTAQIVGEICTRLDGLPLAIELAAARVRHLSPSAMLGRMEWRLPLLIGGPRDLPARQQTLRDAITWSYDLLSAAEQRLFARLAIFAGGCDLPAIAAVCETEASDVSLLDRMSRLVDQSLVQRSDGSDGEPRYSMLETIRELAFDQLDARGEVATCRQRHADYMVRLSEEAEGHLARRSPTRARWLGRISDDHENVRAALAWSTVTPGCIEPGLRIAGNLYWFWRLGNHWREIRGWLESALARADAVERTETRAKALWCLGMQTYYLNDYKAADSRLEESAEIFRQLGARRWLSLALSALGLVRRIQGDYAARSLQEEAVSICRHLDDPSALAGALFFLGSAPGTAEDHERAYTALTESATLHRELGYPWALAPVLLMLGIGTYQRGDHIEARAQFAEALAIFRGVDDRWYLARTLRGLGQIARDEDDVRGGFDHFQEALALYQALSDRAGVADCLEGLGGVARSDPQRSIRLLAAADALREAVGVRLDALDRAEADREITKARSTIDASAFAAAWTEGRALSIEQAIELALLQPEPGSASIRVSTSPVLTESDDVLSAREREVATLVAAGLSNRQIAEHLIISERTVHGHVASILSKLDFRSRSQIAVWAVRHGLNAMGET